MADVPDYADELRALHEAYSSEFQTCVGTLQIPPGASIIDVPCGDGFFTACLARLLKPDDLLIAADLSRAYLDEAERTVAGIADSPRLRFIEADAYQLPFDDATFDVVWCAQSMISLPDPVKALQEFYRVLKPQGRVAVLENDELHHVLFDWPVELELEIGTAMRKASRETFGSRHKLFATRNLQTMFRKAGFDPLHRQTFAADRHAPFPPATRAYLEYHLARVRRLTSPQISVEIREELDSYTVPGSSEFLLDQKDTSATYIWTLSVGRKD